MGDFSADPVQASIDQLLQSYLSALFLTSRSSL
jgi:hypothetical protein